MDEREYRFPLYTTEPVVTAVQAVVIKEISRLARLKRPSKAQRQLLALLRAGDSEITKAYGDMEAVD